MLLKDISVDIINEVRAAVDALVDGGLLDCHTTIGHAAGAVFYDGADPVRARCPTRIIFKNSAIGDLSSNENVYSPNLTVVLPTSRHSGTKSLPSRRNLSFRVF